MAKRSNTKDFLEKCIHVHGDKYDYSNTQYTHSKAKVEIICREHGMFLQTPNHHLRGKGCPVCGYKHITDINNKRHNNIKKNFIHMARGVHMDKYEYLSEYIDHSVKILIRCNICGVEFRQKPHNHLSGQGCPSCKSSKGEQAIERWLIDNNIEYVKEKWFDDCRGLKRPLPFDFWIEDLNILIEFQGRQHYELVKFSQRDISENEMIERYEATKLNDKIKRQYCLDKGIQLIDIPYWDLKHVDNILDVKII